MVAAHDGRVKVHPQMSLHEVQEGDTVRYYGPYASYMMTVTRVTECQIVCENRKFWKHGGYEVGDRNGKHYVRPATSEEISAFEDGVRRKEMVAFISANLDKLPLEETERIFDIVTKYMKDDGK